MTTTEVLIYIIGILTGILSFFLKGSCNKSSRKQSKKLTANETTF